VAGWQDGAGAPRLILATWTKVNARQCLQRKCQTMGSAFACPTMFPRPGAAPGRRDASSQIADAVLTGR
jgi:hypothetical protein